MLDLNINTEVILMGAILLLVLIIFFVMVSASIASIFSEARKKAESDTAQGKTQNRS